MGAAALGIGALTIASAGVWLSLFLVCGDDLFRGNDPDGSGILEFFGALARAFVFNVECLYLEVRIILFLIITVPWLFVAGSLAIELADASPILGFLLGIATIVTGIFGLFG